MIQKNNKLNKDKDKKKKKMIFQNKQVDLEDNQKKINLP